ncbi:MAG: hypothetical protein M3Y70_03380 [Pseudomonadota bacterium]|nr:hypothetical protein [Pseudomonadota bacterium]
MQDFLRHVPFFARLDALMDMPEACTGAWLLEHIPVREMREHLQIMRFLEDQVGIVLTPAQKQEAVERDRLGELVRLARERPFKDVIVAFAEALATRGSQLRTQRQYLATAVAFCESAGVETQGWKDQAAAQFLKKVPGQRANLGVFFKFCRDTNGWRCAQLPAAPAMVRDAMVVRRFQALWRQLEADGDAATRPELARLIEKAFALKRGTLEQAQVIEVRSTPYLALDGTRHLVPKPMRALVSRWWALLAADSAGV